MWTPADDLDPAALRGRKTRAEQRQDDRNGEGKAAILSALSEKPDTARGLVNRGCGTHHMATKLLRKLAKAGIVESETIKRRGQPCELWRLVA